MEQQQFGQTDLETTQMGLGMAALGRPGYINLGHDADIGVDKRVEAMREHAFEVLDGAWAAGIRYFDAARSYGRAEDFLGKWLLSRQIPETDVVIGSKWGYTYTAGWRTIVGSGETHEIKEHTLPVLERQISESRARLGGYLNLYQVHSATMDSGILSNAAVLGSLAQLREQGLVIGLSVSGTGQRETLFRAMEIELDGVPLFASVQATWNVLERSAGQALRTAHEEGLAVIVKEALANGRLTTRNNAAAFASKRRLLTELAADNGVAIDAIALAAAVNQSWADVVLSGAAALPHLVSNLNALAVDWTAELDELLYQLCEESSLYWRTRGQLAWN